LSDSGVDGQRPCGHQRWIGDVRYASDCVAKLDKEQLARNIRIEARKFLNQHCALALGLESILRAGPLKIVLQQNPSDSGRTAALRRTVEKGHLRTWHGKATVCAHEDKTPLLRVAPWGVACAPCGLERIG
jgi:hypothetical protein